MKHKVNYTEQDIGLSISATDETYQYVEGRLSKYEWNVYNLCQARSLRNMAIFKYMVWDIFKDFMF